MAINQILKAAEKFSPINKEKMHGRHTSLNVYIKIATEFCFICFGL